MPDATIRPPSYDGGGLLNLVAELERRLTGRSPSPPLREDLADLVPDAASYVLVMIDGLGDAQLAHPTAAPLARSRVAALDAPFPTTTTVSLSTLVTGLPPVGHGVIGHFLWMPDRGEVVNTLRWMTLYGQMLEVDTSRILPSPNLWERLRAAGLEPVTVQPAGFMGSPLSQMLYRGCRFEPVWDTGEVVEATRQLAAVPGRLVLTYLPHVDLAAHFAGQESADYREAVGLVAEVWERLAETVPGEVGLLGTSDHGHLDYDEQGKRLIREPELEAVFFGDARGMMTRADQDRLDRLAAALPATRVEGVALRALWGEGRPHPALEGRLPDALFLADPGSVLLPRGFDKRLVGYHGGLDPAEVAVPLLVC